MIDMFAAITEDLAALPPTRGVASAAKSEGASAA